jgi:hypothetical protein
VLPELLTDMKAASLAALVAGSRPAPDQAYVGEGDVAYDCPNSLVVTFEGLSGVTRSTPDGRVESLPPLATIAVHLLRCAAPVLPDAGPLPADIESSGLGLAADLDALLNTHLGDCQPIQFLSAALPRSLGGDLAPVVVRWLIDPTP